MILYFMVLMCILSQRILLFVWFFACGRIKSSWDRWRNVMVVSLSVMAYLQFLLLIARAPMGVVCLMWVTRLNVESNLAGGPVIYILFFVQ